MPRSRALKEACRHAYGGEPDHEGAHPQGMETSHMDAYASKTDGFGERNKEAFEGKNSRHSLETANEPENMDYGSRDFDDPSGGPAIKGSSMNSPGWSKKRAKGQPTKKAGKGYSGFF